MSDDQFKREQRFRDFKDACWVGLAAFFIYLGFAIAEKL